MTAPRNAIDCCWLSLAATIVANAVPLSLRADDPHARSRPLSEITNAWAEVEPDRIDVADRLRFAEDADSRTTITRS